ncbi:hypothetical protein lerEdw1_003908 [Lerista edwardsae]|nr:hypothetical protein lerEdw1_003908 [Lerista edwardsae]
MEKLLAISGWKLLDLFFTYPSGHSAVYQSYSNLPDGGMYTNIFDDVPDQVLLGTFTPFGRGSVCFPSSNNIAMIYNQEGGMVTNKGGEILREWKWPGVGKLDTPVIVQVNKCLTVKIAGRFAISLVYKWYHESVQLSLSPVRSVVVPQPNLSKATKTPRPRAPEADPGRIKDFSATRELRKLKRKIKSIMENWLEYYQIAFGLDSLQTPKTFPLQAERRHKAQPPAISPDLQRQQRKKCHDNEVPALVGLSRFQSAPARSPRQDVPRAASRAPYLLNRTPKTNQPLVRHINKDKPISQISSNTSEKPWYPSSSSCPAALRRAMLGGERKLCSCSNYQIPYVTDLEYNHIINNAVSAPEQITVICVTSSLKATDCDPTADGHLESLYERTNKNRSMPCIQNCQDSFRLLKYDINTADRFTDRCGSLLVKRHNVAPGMFLMYIQGKLLFANYIFNGYSKSTKDLQKQIALTRCDYNRGYYLPTDYRFSSTKDSWAVSTWQASAGQAVP